MGQFGSGTMAGPPSGVTLTYAGFWLRFVASFIDGILINVALGLASLVLGLKLMDYNYDPASGNLGASTASSGAGAISFLIAAAFSIGFWLWRGATPGKMLFKMQVVRADTGLPITPGQAIGRYLGYFVSALVFLLGFIWAGFDARKQAWHDKLAGTVAVRRRDPEAVAFR